MKYSGSGACLPLATLAACPVKYCGNSTHPLGRLCSWQLFMSTDVLMQLCCGYIHTQIGCHSSPGTANIPHHSSASDANVASVSSESIVRVENFTEGILMLIEVFICRKGKHLPVDVWLVRWDPTVPVKVCVRLSIFPSPERERESISIQSAQQEFMKSSSSWRKTSSFELDGLRKLQE